MIRINLLPFRAVRKKRKYPANKVSFFLLFSGLVAVALLLAHLYMGNWVNSLQAQTNQVDTEIKRYEEIGKQVDENKKRIEVINKKKNVINSLIKDRYKPVRLLGVLTEMIITDQMWLTSLSTQGAGVRIKGVAMDETDCGRFYDESGKFGAFLYCKFKHG